MLDSNVFIVEEKGRCLIVDCAVELSKIKEFVGNNKVDGILLTHGHYDHSAYCNEYAREYSCKIYANLNIKQTLLDIEAIYSEKTDIIDDFSKFMFVGDCKLKVGIFDVECISAQGHSVCSECYKIENSLFAGDVLFENGIGRTDLIGSDKEEMLKTLTKLENISFDKVFSGHGNGSDFEAQKKNILIFKRFLSR